MEFMHEKTWALGGLMIGMLVLLLYTFGGIYTSIGIFVGFLDIVFMAAIYINLYESYKTLEVEIVKIDREYKKKLAEFKSAGD